VIIMTTRDTLCRPALQYQLAQQIGAEVLPLDADHDVPVVDARLFGDAVVEAIHRVDGSAPRKRSQ
jgi:3-oxoadipate enol-lactonase